MLTAGPAFDSVIECVAELRRARLGAPPPWRPLREIGNVPRKNRFALPGQSRPPSPTASTICGPLSRTTIAAESFGSTRPSTTTTEAPEYAESVGGLAEQASERAGGRASERASALPSYIVLERLQTPAATAAGLGRPPSRPPSRLPSRPPSVLGLPSSPPSRPSSPPPADVSCSNIVSLYEGRPSIQPGRLGRPARPVRTPPRPRVRALRRPRTPASSPLRHLRLQTVEVDMDNVTVRLKLLPSGRPRLQRRWAYDEPGAVWQLCALQMVADAAAQTAAGVSAAVAAVRGQLGQVPTAVWLVLVFELSAGLCLYAVFRLLPEIMFTILTDS
ncbi:uncharacterized protein V1510DRAFT_401650 [Dipodascopsis tothii]|uniref:uncharacterized protein n=1 Tax=Dipodascopsis tothii TaxID=44089 RepID=UPI0034CDEDB8